MSPCWAHGKAPPHWTSNRHALPSVADLSVRKVAGAGYVIANLTLDIREVAFDYLATPRAPKLVVNQ